MDTFALLGQGLLTALEPMHLLYALIGVTLGTAVGVLPGIGPALTVALLLPITFKLDPGGSLIMFAGIYYGGMYGGSTTAILLNTPGESASVVTALEGNQMARRGRGGPALATAAIGSFVAALIATAGLAFFAPILVKVAVKFGPWDYFGLMLIAFVTVSATFGSSPLRGLTSLGIGLWLGLIGIDQLTGQTRLSFGVPNLLDGVEVTTLAVGLFALGEALFVASRHLFNDEKPIAIKGSIWMSREDWKRSWKPWLRGKAVGFPIGALPAGGAEIPTFLSYTMERKLAEKPEEFGKGAIEGVASPEAANNASAQTSFIPLLTLGIPSTAVMAVMAGALTIQGIQPGPHVLNSRPELFWGLIVSMWVGNLMLVIINLPLVGIWVRMLRIPYRIFYPAILIFSCVGVYSLRNSYFDVMLVALFGLLGYCLQRWRCDTTPLVLAFVLSPMLEDNLRRAMLISRGDPAVFVERPLSLGMLLVALALLGFVLLPSFRKRREVIFEED